MSAAGLLAQNRVIWFENRVFKILPLQRERELMEDEDEVDLPEIEEDEINLEEDQMLNIEGSAHDKETAEGNELHPKLIPLLLSIAFMLINLILVSLYNYIVFFRGGGGGVS